MKVEVGKSHRLGGDRRAHGTVPEVGVGSKGGDHGGKPMTTTPEELARIAADPRIETWCVTLRVLRSIEDDAPPREWNWEELVGYGTEVIRTRKVEPR